jgi:hypothetical protein
MDIATLLTPVLARTLVVEAAHLALRVIRFREGAPRLMSGLRAQATDKDEAAEVALKVLEAIQAGEGRPIAELTNEQAEQYSQQLTEVVEQRVKADGALDKSVAEDKLRDIRSSY